MALKFLNKKGWHTGSLRNIENVWKAEQKHAAEQKKLEELRKQIQDEREQLEFRQLQEQAGLVPKQERLEFLYDSGLAVGRNNSEGFATLGKPVEPQQRDEPRTDLQKLASAPGALFVEEKPQSANDTWRKLHSDPLLMIRQREQEALAQIKNNPVKMEMIKKSLEEKKQLKEDKARKQRKEAKARRKAEKRKHHKEKKRQSISTDTDTGTDTASNERKKRKWTKHTTNSDSDSDFSAGNSYDVSNKNSRNCYTEPKVEKCYDRMRGGSIKGQSLESGLGQNRADFKCKERANDTYRDWRYDGIPRDSRTSKPYLRDRQRSRSHSRERPRSPSHHRESHRVTSYDRERQRSSSDYGERHREKHSSDHAHSNSKNRYLDSDEREGDRESHRVTLYDRERQRSSSDYGERHREKHSSDHAHSNSKNRYLDSDEREGDKNGLHPQSAVNGSHDVRDKCSDSTVALEKPPAGLHISSKPASRGKYQAGKLSEEEKAARLREMQIDAELHDEQRWHRLKKASDADALEAKQATAISGRNFLDATNRSIYGAEKGGSATIEESVRRRTHYLQGSAAAVEANAFRR